MKSMVKVSTLRAVAQRWKERANKRGDMAQKLAEGKPADEPGRVQLRLKRLSELARRGPALERIFDTNDLRPNNPFFTSGMAMARCVGRVVVRDDTGVLGYGTGFMVTPHLLLTNNHVLETAETAGYSTIEFDFDADRHGTPLAVSDFALEPHRFFITDVDLDYSLVAVSPQPLSAHGAGLEEFGWARLIKAQGKAVVGDPVNIIQHPGGRAKQVALRNNQVLDIFEDFLHYRTDTEPGASGAPVSNDQWEVVALHHSAVPAMDANGNILTRDNRIWDETMSAESIQWVANEGIRVSSLVEHISRADIKGSEPELLNQLLTAQAPLPVVPEQKPSISGGTATSIQVVAGGQTFTIPLSLQLQVGAPVAQTTAPFRKVEPSGASAISGLVDIDQLLEEGEKRPYYDHAADEAAIAAYYADIAPSDDPSRNFGLYSDLVIKTHRNRLNYSPSRHVYPWVDLHERDDGSRVLRSIYSGKAYSARELIERDQRIELERTQRQEALRRERLSVDEAVREQEQIEAALPYNCEHVVPQSWFSKREPMRGDLHHLFACESGCNSFRGNIPFDDFPDFDEVIRSQCGRRETGAFEPAAGKGAVARATLYFLLRYPDEINSTAREYKAERIAVLLAWHRDNPPDRYEHHRNAAIFELQGNRNPLIDQLALADRIDFKIGLG